MDKYLDEKKFYEKIMKICEKIEKIEQSFNKLFLEKPKNIFDFLDNICNINNEFENNNHSQLIKK